MKETTETREFDAKASEEVLKKLDGLSEDQTLPVVLKVRAPGDQFDMVLDECWQEIVDSAAALRTSVSDYDSYVDKKQGFIHVRVNPHLGRSLIQRDDLFWFVGWDADRWR